MNAEGIAPQRSQGAEDAAGRTGRDHDDEPGRSSLRRAMRRAASALKFPRGGNATERLTEILNDEEQQEGAPTQEERALLFNVLKLRDLRVDDVMVPRADIVAVEENATLEETLSAFRTETHSRLPVYRETLDDPIGVVHLKDVALSHGFGGADEAFHLNKHLRSMLVVPPSMRIQALLSRMQATRRHMALVIDEYGGVDGLVTIEDVIEQIVGQIEDEHDDDERPLWLRQGDGAYLAEARAEVPHFEAASGARLMLEDWEEEVDTLGGLIFMLSGRVPERGEVIAHPSGHEFEIVDADPRRIKRVRVRLRLDSETALRERQAHDETRGRAETEARTEDLAEPSIILVPAVEVSGTSHDDALADLPSEAAASSPSTEGGAETPVESAPTVNGNPSTRVNGRAPSGAPSPTEPKAAETPSEPTAPSKNETNATAASGAKAKKPRRPAPSAAERRTSETGPSEASELARQSAPEVSEPPAAVDAPPSDQHASAVAPKGEAAEEATATAEPAPSSAAKPRGQARTGKPKSRRSGGRRGRTETASPEQRRT